MAELSLDTPPPTYLLHLERERERLAEENRRLRAWDHPHPRR
eukprot:gene16523-17794_t